MQKILIVDDDITIVRFLKDLISKTLHFPCESATSFNALEKLIDANETYAIALVDVILPDAKDAEAIDLVLSHGISTIAMTGSDNKEIRELVKSKNILDYVYKDNPSSFDYALRLIQFVYGFEGAQILLVDDSLTSRMQLKFSLEKLPLVVYEAKDGLNALEVLKEHPKIRLIITDQNMPNMNGIEMIKEVRKTHNMSQVSVIGISASSDSCMSIEFLKNGANDYLNKPFMPEEVFSRVIATLEMQYYVQLAEDVAVRDFLTGLHNRKYLFETGGKLYENAKRETLSIVVAMIDIDYFKKINDRYGHEAGDIALKMLGELMQENFRDSDVITRYGGEEFCVILTNTELKNAHIVMDKVRQKVEDMKIKLGTINFRMSISIGLNAKKEGSFDQMIALADKKLYQAKNEGRNRVLS